MVACTQAQVHYNHVLNEVLGRDNNPQLKQALVHQGFGSLPALMSMEDGDIDHLSFRAADGTDTLVTRGDAGLIRAFCRYIAHRRAEGPALDEDWTMMVVQDFNTFRMSHIQLTRTANAAPNAVPGTVVMPPPRSQERFPVSHLEG